MRRPKNVKTIEGDSFIPITVTGVSSSEPCSMQYMTLIGYVQLTTVGNRQVTGYAS